MPVSIAACEDEAPEGKDTEFEFTVKSERVRVQYADELTVW